VREVAKNIFEEWKQRYGFESLADQNVLPNEVSV